MKTYNNLTSDETMRIHSALLLLKNAIADFEYCDIAFMYAMELEDSTTEQLEAGNKAMQRLQSSLLNTESLIL